MAEAFVGISGWTYANWRGVWYPPRLAHRLELSYAADRLTSIEINGSFYSLQRPSSHRRWRDQTPAGFVFAVKGGRFITHMKRLVDIEAPLANFFASGLLALGPKLGPVLWQLPPTLAYDESTLAAFLDRLPRTTYEAAALGNRHDDRLAGDRVFTDVAEDRPLRHALEVRHSSFAAADAVSLLRAYGVALVTADTAGRWPALEDATAEFRYVRLHGADELYVSGYTDEALDGWAGRIRGWLDSGQDVYVYFDNDVKVHAPRDAEALIARLSP